MPQSAVSAARSKTGYMPGLDGWRAVAILAVLCNHDPDSHGIGFLTRHLHELGWAGVDLFFAISGLLICSRLLEEERLNGCISMRGFYTRRVFRILPPAYAFLAVSLALGLAHQIPWGLPGIVASLLMVRNYWWVYGGLRPNELYTDHFWSLSVEEHFYLLLPALLIFVRRRILCLSLLSVAAFCWFLFFVRYRMDNGLHLAQTDLRVLALLFPALLAVLLAKPGGRVLAVKWIHPWFWIGVGGVLAFSLHHLPAGYRYATLALYFPFLVIGTLVHPESLTCRMLEWKPVRYVGRLSYGIYLWQQIFLLRSGGARWPFLELQHFPLNYLALAACVVASYYLLEKPLIALGHRLAPPATPGHPPADYGTASTHTELWSEKPIGVTPDALAVSPRK